MIEQALRTRFSPNANIHFGAMSYPLQDGLRDLAIGTLEGNLEPGIRRLEMEDDYILRLCHCLLKGAERLHSSRYLGELTFGIALVRVECYDLH